MNNTFKFVVATEDNTVYTYTRTGETNCHVSWEDSKTGFAGYSIDAVTKYIKDGTWLVLPSGNKSFAVYVPDQQTYKTVEDDGKFVLVTEGNHKYTLLKSAAKMLIHNGLWEVVDGGSDYLFGESTELPTNENVADNVTLKFISDILAQCNSRAYVSMAGFDSKYEVTFDDNVYQIDSDDALRDCLVGCQLIVRSTCGK